MKYTLSCPEKILRGDISLPSSKSISNRLLIIQALSAKKFDIINLSGSDDTQALYNGLRSASEVIDIGHAGTSMRFLTAYFAATGQVKTITGSERMQNRPIGNLVEALNQLGGEIRYLQKDGYPPVQTSGKPLLGRVLHINGNVSSQFISALLLVAPALSGGLELHIEGGLVSSSYVDMTLGLMHRAGVESIRDNRTVKIVPQCYCPENITVEHDWSAASYWYQIALLADTCSILLRGVTGNSLQGDAVVAAMCEPLGVHTQYTADGALLTRSTAEYARMDADFINAPDLVQTMAVALCLKNIPFRFDGVKTLRVKETDRIVALRNELMKLGYCIETSGSNVLEWTGKRCEPQKNICISTYHDHRMAMAFAPAAILFPDIQIEDPGVVSKSYPDFWQDLQKTGFVIDRL